MAISTRHLAEFPGGVAGGGGGPATLTINDSVSITDQPAGVAHTKVLADSMSVSDAGFEHSIEYTLDDGATAGDAVSRAWAVARTVTDTAGLTDGVTTSAGGGATNWTKTIADTVAIGDSSAKAAKVNRNDTAAASEAVARVWAAIRAPADVAAVIDAFAAGGGIAPAYLTLSDGASVHLIVSDQ